jgi:hypothetical protein
MSAVIFDPAAAPSLEEYFQVFFLGPIHAKTFV